MIADMLSNKKLQQIVTEVFVRGRKLSVSSVFVYGKPYSFLVNNANLASNNHLRFWRNLSARI